MSGRQGTSWELTTKKCQELPCQHVSKIFPVDHLIFSPILWMLKAILINQKMTKIYMIKLITNFYSQSMKLEKNVFLSQKEVRTF